MVVNITKLFLKRFCGSESRGYIYEVLHAPVCHLPVSPLFCGRSTEKEHRCMEQPRMLNADGRKGSPISSAMNAEFGSWVIFLKRYLSKEHPGFIQTGERNVQVSEAGC